jgi:hypothetical protein
MATSLYICKTNKLIQRMQLSCDIVLPAEFIILLF